MKLPPVGVIDCDVHHTWPNQAELFEFLPAAIREELLAAEFKIRAASSYPPPGGTNKRLDAYGPDDAPPGSSYEMLRDQLLDPFSISHAVLSFDIGHEASHPNPRIATALARAANDWNVATWLERGDERIYGALMVPNHLPAEAAAEIRRVGGHERIVEVLLVAGGLGLPLGHPAYHPIYEAAAEMGLPVAIHVGAEWYPHAIAASGLPGTRFEYHTVAGQSVIHHATSFLTHGVFERFPGLNLILVEIGLAWLPWLLWSLDSVRDDLAAESGWLKHAPSDYFRDRVRISTQPMEMTPEPAQLVDLLSAVEGVERMICFASDYPHWDTDELSYIGKRLPEEWLPRVLAHNAAEVFGFEVRELSGEPAR